MNNLLSNGTYMMAMDAINKQLVEEEEEAAFKTRTISRETPSLCTVPLNIPSLTFLQLMFPFSQFHFIFMQQYSARNMGQWKKSLQST